MAAGSSSVNSLHIGDNGDLYVGSFSEMMSRRLGCSLEEVVEQMDGLQEEVQKLFNVVRG